MLRTDVAVVGGGFSAAAAICNLLECLGSGRTIGVIGRTATLGLGTAYSTEDDTHRLNVPAGRMSMFPDRPNHLMEWLGENEPQFGPEDFIPRRIYGRYVQDTLQACLYHKDNRAEVHFLDAEAIDCEDLADGRQVYHLSDGSRLEATASIFCLGGTPQGLPLPADRVDPRARPHICVNVWADRWLDRAKPDDSVFMLGSGLTMIDQVLSLRRRGHRGPIHIVSRHGLIPLPHKVPRTPQTEPVITPGSAPLSQLMKRMRVAARNAGDWRSVVDGIRPVTQALWQHLSEVEKQRFLRHANSWWSIHRHRLAPDMAATFEEMRASGQVTVSAGWLHEVREYNGQARIAYKDRHTGTLRQLSADWLVNCTGMEKCSISKVPLLKKMSARGQIAADSLGLGLAVTEESEVIRQDGRTVGSTYALGPMTIGQFFEIFAVPDIRSQASRVSRRIAAMVEAA